MLRAICKDKIASSVYGFVFGILMAVNFYFDPFPSIDFVSKTVQLPAIWCAYFWSVGLNMPPQNQIGAWVVVPMVAIICQWTLVGFLFGFWRCRKSRPPKQQ